MIAKDDANDESPPLILIVDDEATNLQLAGSIIQKEGYDVAFAKTGYKAVTMVEADRPDLILLDVMMPGMDGFKVCERLKRNPQLRDIPVIFLTAKSETEDIVKGFNAGGADYVLKPFRSGELLARVKTQIALQLSKKQGAALLEKLQAKNQELSSQKLKIEEQSATIQRANDEMAQRNEVLQQMSESKSELLSMASHDLRNPIAAISGIAGLMRLRLEDASVSGKISKEDLLELIGTIEQSGKNMLTILSEMLDNEALESGKVSLRKIECSLGLLAREVVAFNQPQATKKEIKLEFSTSGDVEGAFDISRMREVLDNLISNAIKFSEQGTTVSVAVDDQGEYPTKYRVLVADEGPGFTEDDKQKMFSRFTKLSAQPTGGELSTGLGLSIVKKLIDLHEGSIELISERGKGSTFIVSLP